MTRYIKRLRPIAAARSMRIGVGALLAPLCLMLFACSQPPTVVLDTPTGAMPLNSTGPVMPGGLVTPPLGMEPAMPPPSLPVSREGRYAGTADVLSTGGGLCTDVLKVTGFSVQGNSARFGGYRGTIAADGGVQMVYGQSWLVGQFEGATFRGHLDLPGRFGAPGCTYMLNLERTGP